MKTVGITSNTILSLLLVMTPAYTQQQGGKRSGCIDNPSPTLSAFEHGREVRVAGVIEAIELQASGVYDLKTSIAASGFVKHSERSTRR